MKRRTLLGGMAALPSLHLMGAHAQGAAYPTKPIRAIVSSAPGALLDQATRLYGDRMSAILKQPIVVENIAGAGALIAARQAAKAEPDGYTLLTVANTIVTIPHLNPKAGYSMKDFVAVGEMVRSPSLLVVANNSPIRTLADIVAAAKKPGGLAYASGGIGTTSHLPVELFARQAGVKFTHVPYKGNATAIPDVVAGRVPFMMGTTTSYSELLKSGQLRAIAITSEERSPKYPNVPTFKEQGFDEASFEIWIGMIAPAGTPAPVIQRLAAAMEAARSDKALVERLDAAGQTISKVRTPAQFAAVLRNDEEKLRKLIVEAGITAE